MSMKNTAEVVIAGRVYKISGYESPEYLHQIAVYLNDKMSDLQKAEGYRRQSADQKQLLLNMNLADDYFKSRGQAEKLSADLDKKERELYSVRHDLVEAQLALENQRRELEELKEKERAERRELEALKKQWKELEERKAEELKTQREEAHKAEVQKAQEEKGREEKRIEKTEQEEKADVPGGSLAAAASQAPEDSGTSPAQTQGQNQPRQNHSRGRRHHSGNSSK